MPQINIIENYADDTILTQAQLTQAFQSVEDFLNLTRIDEENIIPASITAQSIAPLSIDATRIAPSTLTLNKLAQEVVDKLVPTGSVSAFAGTVIPSGWLYCNGDAVSRTTFASLFGQIGIIHGSGDGSSTFNLPDYRGWFLRGQDDGAGNDPDASGRTAPGVGGATGDSVGSVEPDRMLDHYHANSLNDPGHFHNSNADFIIIGQGGGSIPTTGGAQRSIPNTTTNGTNMTISNAYASSTGFPTSSENRPKNKNVRYIIKI